MPALTGKERANPGFEKGFTMNPSEWSKGKPAVRVWETKPVIFYKLHYN